MADLMKSVRTDPSKSPLHIPQRPRRRAPILIAALAVLLGAVIGFALGRAVQRDASSPTVRRAGAFDDATLLAARGRAQDKQAQSNLRNALTSEKTFYVDEQHYATDAGADLPALQGIESSLQWGNPAAAMDGVDVTSPAVACAAGTAGCQTVVMRSDSVSSTVFCLGDVATAVVPTDAGTYYASGAACPAADPPSAGWSKDVSIGW